MFSCHEENARAQSGMLRFRFVQRHLGPHARAALAAAGPPRLARPRAGRAARRERPDDPQRRRAAARPRLPGRRGARRGGPLPARRRAPSCRRCCSTTRRRSPSPSGCGRATASRASRRPAGGRWPSWSRCCRTGCGGGSPRCTRRPRRARRTPGATSPTRRSTPRCSATLAAAVRDHERVRLDHPPDGDRPLVVEPYRLVSWQRRWYLVARVERPVARAAGRPR